MLKNLNIEKIILTIVWIALMGGLFVLLGFVKKTQDGVLCKSVIISIDTTNEMHFINDELVKEIINDKGDVFIGKPVSEINIFKTEKLLRENYYIENADVYSTISGEIKINIKQRKPLIRIVNLNNESYYIDSNGFVMPASRNFTARILIANGFIWEPYISFRKVIISDNDSLDNSSLLTQLLILAKYVSKDDFWKAQIAQVYINLDREIELIPRLGNHTVLLGDVIDMEEKFDNLMDVYQKGFKNTGWEKYTLINLKYKNQIVCTKK
ncbi:MAG: hypothetical protein PHD97_11085 [Bacteroidales bacterium]|nr:hypothetical protein [Bacteroidales bacterium]